MKTKTTDLFENIGRVPERVQNILASFNADECTYENCAELNKQLNKVGFKIEYGLDAVPYNLQEL